MLLSNGISAAPVFDEAKNSFIGMFDYGDLMAYILILLKKMDPPQDQTLEMRDLIQKANNSQSVPVRLASGTFFFCEREHERTRKWIFEVLTRPHGMVVVLGHK